MLQKMRTSITQYVFRENIPEKSDIIFIPGNGYPQMAEQAAQLYHKGYAPLILPSGKYSITVGHFDRVLAHRELYAEKYETEWEFLSDVLMKNGVPEDAILREDQAVMTCDNAMNSRKVTDQQGLGIQKAILCCKNYHAGRCAMYYSMAYPETELFVVPSTVDSITKDNWYRTEEGVRQVMAEAERSISQYFVLMKLP